MMLDPMSEPTELLPELLERCRDGDRQAAERLVRRFYNYALTLARALVDDSQTEDVVQEAMLTMLAHLDQVRDPHAFAGWLRQIVRTHAARAARRRSPLLGLAEEPPVYHSPADRAQLHELCQQVRAALACLPLAGQQTARLYYIDGLDQRQIAIQLAVPVGTVKRRLYDARVKLRKILRPDLPL
jgi:RNA polymerase sigma-70 factor (ECF subfamily)